MKFSTQTVTDVVQAPYSNGAIIREDFPGFREDYLVIYSLIRKHNPKHLMEIGTSTGKGTNVLCKAMGLKRYWLQPKDKTVHSIDVPPGTDPNVLYPEKEDGHPEKAGMYCKYPYKQLFGDSIDFDFKPHYPIDAWFIDGKHDYKYAYGDTEQALKSNPSLLIWHDMQIDDVSKAVGDIMSKHKEYEVYVVKDTRIGYAIKKGS